MLDRKAVFWNTAIQSIVRLTALVFTLVSIKLLSNYLGTTGVGQYNTITTYVNFFIVIADLGLFSVAVREIAKNPENEKKIISNVFFVRLISAILACALAVFILFFTPYKNDHNLYYGVIIACGFLFFNLLASIYDIILQYRLKMQFSALAELFSKLLTLLALYIIIRLHGSFLYVTSTIALSGILIFLFKWYFSRRFIKFNLANDRKFVSWIFNLAWPMGIIFIINNLFLKLDTLMLFAFKGAAAVGIYSVAYKVLEVTVFIGSYFSSALKPALAQNIEENKAQVASVIEKSLSIMLLISAPIAAICIVFSREIIIFLSNKDFVAGSSSLIVLGLTLPFAYINVLLSEILIAKDERKNLMKISLIALGSNFIFNLILIPRYSYFGAALGNPLSQILLLAANLYYGKKIVDFKINGSYLFRNILIFGLTVLFGFLIKAFPINFIILIIISMVFYAGLSLLFKLVDKSTLKSLLSR